jgi:cytochrome c oxidase subunit 3/cytochrome o ubiquinol oxidase subunit 3
MINAPAHTFHAEPTAGALPSRGRVGMICLIATEAALFAIFVAAYLFYIGKSLSGPSPAHVLEVPILSTLCLLASSATIMLAERALHQGYCVRFTGWWFLTMLLGVEFLRATAVEWYRLIFTHHLTISTNLFGTTFYSLVGFHAMHVTVGLVLLTLVLLLNLCGYVTQAQSERVAVLSLYWHFVDVVWLVVFLVVYIIGR